MNDGYVLNRILRERQMDKKALADKINVTRQAVVNYTKSASLNDATLRKVLDALDMTYDDFIQYKQKIAQFDNVSSVEDEPVIDQAKNQKSEYDKLHELYLKAIENEKRLIEIVAKLTGVNS